MENKEFKESIDNLTDKLDSFLHLMEDKVKREEVALLQTDQLNKSMNLVEKYLRILVDKYQEQEGIDKIVVEGE